MLKSGTSGLPHNCLACPKQKVIINTVYLECVVLNTPGVGKGITLGHLILSGMRLLCTTDGQYSSCK